MPKAKSSLPTQEWQFVEDTDLRELLDRDYKELKKLLKIGANKSILLMCGSILEAALVSFLLQKKALAQDERSKAIPDKDELCGWTLNKLVNFAVELKYLGKQAEINASILREYRNLIHPGREHRQEITVSPGLVITVLELFKDILRRLSSETGSKPDGSLEDRFLQKLQQKKGAGEAEVARKIIEWAKDKELHPYWTRTLNYMPELNHKGSGSAYRPIVISTGGRIRVRFGNLKRAPYFRYKANRQKLWRHLNEIPGVRISAENIDKYPAILLATLKNEEGLDQFLKTLDWVVRKIEIS